MAGRPRPSIARRAAGRPPADEVDDARHGKRRSNAELSAIKCVRPVYGALQTKVQALLEDGKGKIPGVYRTEPAPLASRSIDKGGLDFVKWSVPGPLLELIQKQRALVAKGKGEPLDVVTNCVEQRIVTQGRVATALETSRSVLSLGDARLVLAMGTLPPTTLVQQSWPGLPNIGRLFWSHFITSVVARVPRKDLEPSCTFAELELAACYVGGIADNYGQQFHIQLTALSDRHPEKNADIALRCMPDVVATASMAQLKSSKDHIVFICAVLGQQGAKSKSSFTRTDGRDPTTASLLRVVSKGSSSHRTWAAMDRAAFAALEMVLSPNGASQVEYWHGAPDDGVRQPERPGPKVRRVNATVHESTTMHIGTGEDAPVGINYELKGTDNVYITGGAL